MKCISPPNHAISHPELGCYQVATGQASPSNFLNSPRIESPIGEIHRQHEGQQPSILILSEARFIGEGLAEALARALYLADVQAVTSLNEASTRLLLAEPALILIDAAFPRGPDTARRLSEGHSSPRVIAFNVDITNQDRSAWNEAGVIACIDRSLALKEIIDWVASAIVGGRPTERDATVSKPTRNPANALSRSARPGSSISARPGSSIASMLTAREEEVVRLIIAGESNKEIARLLNIELATVKSHVHNLLGKLGLKRRGKLALWYEGRRPSTVASRLGSWPVPEAIVAPVAQLSHAQLPAKVA
jgi:two-component system nitrate/nitrite response regulator NarL